jgi:hypothetical protein
MNPPAPVTHTRFPAASIALGSVAPWLQSPGVATLLQKKVNGQVPESRAVWAWCHPFCTLFIFQFLFLVGVSNIFFSFLSRFLVAGVVLPTSSSFAWI